MHTNTPLSGWEKCRTLVLSIPQNPNIQSAVVQGLYGINTPATFSCPGFKSQCKNVTQETLRSAKCDGNDDFSFGKVREVDFGVANPWKRTPPLENFLVSSTIVTQWVEGNFEKKNLGLAAALSGDVNFDERFKKMAGSMTDYLRYGPNAEAAHGERIESQPFGPPRSSVEDFDACQHEKRLGLLQSTFTDIKLLQDWAGRTEVRLQ
ncbi:hypothetical protein IFM58399_10243 [Aspergillus lentulus]|uniref:Carboxylic ester hydrolase n=1 Tax=Aspergillus lentulus TaxID=293939 RepID=A0ABQ1AYJ0_ASPLE|nr:uncharacterized protein IFM58399_10243 [Aspergillus lentulus]KAF4156962.1 hypothetical protein CNMCM6069_006258 [Aspergillus lentulus]KAF4167020.1 hypothetical protein CNMCM6936_005806 [Aspergillus lentulus]KAF4185418.1 hypothetical protein CNMCM7927_006741 [Aspergillus lentulus]GFF56132.1 hypothetical protein IFM58399_10243 [Aspergillus lentulus]GFF90426.1 hypothetical protein IFM60648_09060 [Aspergillus lentulus]